MDLTAWALYLFIAAVLLAGTGLHYRLREPAGRGRWLLAGLRGGALALLVLLLFDPRIPSPGQGEASVLALVDGSLSMTMPDSTGRTAWDHAMEELDGLEADRILVFGDGPGRAVTVPGDTAPGHLRSRLTPALSAAVEARPGRVVVLTDGAVDDPVEARRALGRSAGLEVRRVGGERAFNVGLTEVRTPAWARTGEEITAEVTVGRVGGGGPDTVTVSLRRGGRELARRRLAAPPPGRMTTVRVPFRADRPSGPEPARIDVVVAPGGSMDADDRRSRYIDIAERPAGVALVSLRPGQEARFLAPTLRRATGLPVRGWLRVSGDRWLRLGTGGEMRLDGPEASREAVRAAEMVVVLGLGSNAPAWASAAVAEHPRVLVLPADGAGGLPFDPGPARDADWYLVSEVPSSPVAALLAGIETAGVPPLTALRTPQPPTGFWTPLLAREGRRGPVRPTLLAGQAAGRRVAVALGTGYWRWAFAGPAGREVYDRYWSAVIGWLAEEEAGGARIRPVTREVIRGEPIRWRVPGDRDSARVRLVRRTGIGAEERDSAPSSPEVDRMVAVEGGLVALPGVPPGRYRYTVTATGTGEGEITVTSYSPELTRPVTLGDTAGPTEAAVERRMPARPLRGTVWPYLAVLLLLSAEWGLRRRWGLR